MILNDLMVDPKPIAMSSSSLPMILCWRGLRRLRGVISSQLVVPEHSPDPDPDPWKGSFA